MRRPLLPLAVLLFVLALPLPAAGVTGERPFVRDLWRASAHDPQKTWETCTIATIRIAASLASGRDRRADAARERRIYDELRAIRTSTYPALPRGLDAHQWAIGMSRYGPGRAYEVVTAASGDSALSLIARRLVQSGLAIGVEVAAGKHAWLVVGVRTDRDPRRGGEFRVLALRVSGPLYPLRRWRPDYDPPPGTWYDAAAFLRRFVPYSMNDDPRYRSRYVMVLPTLGA